MLSPMAVNKAEVVTDEDSFHVVLHCCGVRSRNYNPNLDKGGERFATNSATNFIADHKCNKAA